MKYPFEAEFSEIETTPEPFVSAVFSSLASEFLTLPKGEGFVDYAAFETGYEALKKVTGGFTALAKSEASQEARRATGIVRREWMTIPRSSETGTTCLIKYV